MNTSMVVADMDLEVCKLISQDSVVWLDAECLQSLIYCSNLYIPVVLSTTSVMIVIEPVSINGAGELVFRTVCSIVKPENAADDLDANDEIPVSESFEFFIVEMRIWVDVHLPVFVSVRVVFV